MRGGSAVAGSGSAARLGRLEITREEERMQRPEAANMRFGSPTDVGPRGLSLFVRRPAVPSLFFTLSFSFSPFALHVLVSLRA